MTFSGNRNIVFLDNARKIIFQRDFFGKTIFSEHLEKESTVFRAVKAASHANPGAAINQLGLSSYILRQLS